MRIRFVVFVSRWRSTKTSAVPLRTQGERGAGARQNDSNAGRKDSVMSVGFTRRRRGRIRSVRRWRTLRRLAVRIFSMARIAHAVRIALSMAAIVGRHRTDVRRLMAAEIRHLAGVNEKRLLR